MSDLKRHLSLVLLFALSGSALAFAQSAPAADAPAPRDEAAPKDPYEAYESGHFNQALQGFVDQQVRRPEDPEVALNLGSAHYQMGNYPEAERAFTEAANDDDPDIRFQGFYNLGNTAFRQGKLDEAVAFYQSALEVKPDDEDAKFNLEYTRDEIRRRHEEAQKRQQEQEQQGDQGQEQQQGDQGVESEENSEGEDSQDSGDEGSQGNQEEESQPDASQDEGGDQEQGGDQSSQEQPDAGSPDAGGPDADEDGLPDQVEREGANPTDPQNPDTDGDGLPDGAEDLDRDGEVDPGETDPNRADSDGDGIPDGQDPENTPAGQQTAGAQGETTGGEERPLTAEEAARLLDSLEEGRPVQERPGRNRSRPEKDW